MKRLFMVLLLIVFGCSPQKEQVSPRFNHVMLYVSDIDASINFYTEAFDLQVTNRLSELSITTNGEKNTVEVNMAFLKFPGQDFVYEMSQRNQTVSGAPLYFQHVGIDVVDIDAAFQRLVDAGAEQVAPIRLVEGKGVAAKNAFFRGPDGEMVELMQIMSGEF